MSPLPDRLPVTPFTRPSRGEVRLPGSKSLTNRALLLGALSRGPVTLTGALASEDTHLMAEALRRLGVRVDADGTTLRLSGQEHALRGGEAELFVGLAGTAARFLTSLCAAAPAGCYRLDGVPQMRRRPMQPLIQALRQLGADIRCPGEEGLFPLEIHARGLAGGRVDLDPRESSQLLSALLMVAPLARAEVEIRLTGEAVRERRHGRRRDARGRGPQRHGDYPRPRGFPGDGSRGGHGARPRRAQGMPQVEQHTDADPAV
ncbi:MAG: 3-phosphoshikimate 1-carboxyvinyltransferase, partial [Verrucomicrobiota bacterium]